MKLPNRENAYIPPRKLTEYLLSETHSIGKSKAKFFRAIGFDEENVRGTWFKYGRFGSLTKVRYNHVS